MASETWLRTNSRAMWFGMALPAAFLVVGGLLLFGLPGQEPPLPARVLGGALAAFGLLLAAGMLAQLRRPRLAYRDGQLLVGLTSGPAIQVPIEVVECFWLGQAPSLLPGKRHKHTETASLVIRLAESAHEWHHQEVKPQLGAWCEGYITIRGTWCEPLSIDLVNRLNARLAEVNRPQAAPGGRS
jgi:hypothetical protein